MIFNLQSWSWGWILLVACIILFAVYRRKVKRDHNERIRKQVERQHSPIDNNKIVVATELDGLYVSTSNSRKDRYIELQVEKQGYQKVISTIQGFFGCGITYYKVKEEEKKNNIAFLQSLLQTKKVELFLYTKLTRQIALNLLKKLDLTKYFSGQDRRIFCSSNDTKHPASVDSNIKRVIILTSDRKDYSQEDSQYFLVLKKTELRQYGRALTGLIKNNKNIDEFHHEFVNWKYQIQSDYDSSHQKPE